MRGARQRPCGTRWENRYELGRRPPLWPLRPRDEDEVKRARAAQVEKVAKWVLPVLIMVLAIAGWAWVVQANDIPHFILPGPDRVWDSLVNDWGILIDAAYLTTGGSHFWL